MLKTILATLLFGAAIFCLLLSGNLDRAVAQSTSFSEPTLKVLRNFGLTNFLRELQTSFIPANNFQPVKAAITPGASASFQPPLFPARSTSTVPVSTTAIIRTLAGG